MRDRRALSGRTATSRGPVLSRCSSAAVLLAFAALPTASPASAAAVQASAAGGPSVAHPADAARPAQPAAPASFLRAEDHRLGAIAYRIAVAGLPFCPETAPLTGMMLHHIAEYDAEGRRLVLAAWPLTQGPGVLSVIEASPAARAGLAAGDVIVAVNGAPFRSPEAILAIRDARARRSAIEASEAMLEEQLARGPAQLSVLRGGRRLELELESRPACPARVRLARSRQPNAFANGRYAIVTTQVMGFTRGDDELAIIVAHEVAHNILEHRQRLDEQGVPKGLFRRFGRNAGRIRVTEEEADRLGVRLLAAAGYDTAAIIPFWRRFYARYDSPQLFRTHPGLKAREKLIEEELARIAESDLRAQRP